MRPLSRGDRGKEVLDIQTRLRRLGYFLGREGVDGHFGSKTENATRVFQQERLLLADGIIGENTWTELVEAGYAEGDRLLYFRIPSIRGDDVLALQRRLNELGFDSGPEDGIFGSATEEALMEFQRNAGVSVDGIVGETTWSHLARFRKLEAGNTAGKIPDRMNGYVGSHSLAGLRVTLDPAHGGTDLGERSYLVPADTPDEGDVNLQLAMELSRLLGDCGADVLLVRGANETVGLYERADRANAWNPDIHMCLHHASHLNSTAEGAATFYFTNRTYFSESGKRLAGYLVDACVRELGRVDLHTHGRSYVCLRELQGLTVMVEPGFLTHPREGAELAGPEGVAAEARALLAGLRRYVERR